MTEYNIYEDMSKRTNGDVYIGVVGPVRCGKSTFISSFMKNFVLPNIEDENVKKRAEDELPQSGDGKLVMTTQPKFVPNESVKIKTTGNVTMNIRLIDSVGFMVKGATSSDEEGKIRMVKTPWSEQMIPFDEAGEIGTKKVINEHSNIGLLLTTDNSFSQIEQENYIEAEEKCIKELNKTGKPYIIIVNSATPNSESCAEKQKMLEQKYKVPTISVNATNLTENDVNKIFYNVLSEFKVKSVKVNMPMWLRALPFEDVLIQEVVNEVMQKIDRSEKMDNLSKEAILFEKNSNFEPIVADSVELGSGNIVFNVSPKENLFYDVISKQCNIQIKNDFDIISNLKSLAFAKEQYDKISQAINDAESVGYGVVMPTKADILLQEPKKIKQAGNFTVQVKAIAPSLHIMKVDVETEITPMIGSEEQADALINHFSEQYKTNPDEVLKTNVFGKTMQELIESGINNKIVNIPLDVKKKMCKTMGRITNERKGGVICIII